jgi:hypothetical protein
MKMFTCTCAQDEVTHHRLRGGGSTKSNIGSPPSPACHTPPRGKAARSVCAEYVSTENGDLPARLRVEALQRVDEKPLRRRQGASLAAFSNRSGLEPDECGENPFFGRKNKIFKGVTYSGATKEEIFHQNNNESFKGTEHACSIIRFEESRS